MKAVVKTSIGGPLLALFYSYRYCAWTLSALSQDASGHSAGSGGGYPEANTEAGDLALLNLTTGDWSTAIGFFALMSITTAQFSTGGRCWNAV